MKSEQLYKFLQDPNLISLLEMSKVTDDILDVTDLHENQRSDMLAWCLDPNEGHGQGDLILKDFLCLAFDQWEGRDAKNENSEFFEFWTPGRIMTTGFGSAFVAREMQVKIEGATKGRLDLFIVDPRNKLLIAIENKAGAKLTEEQLIKYTSAIDVQIARRPLFTGFHKLFAVVDTMDRTDPAAFDSMGKRWVFMDYGWLEPAATRARLQVARGNQSAQLLMAYCQLETGWESETEREVSDLVVRLVEQHTPVVDAIRELRKPKIATWTPTSLEGPAGELLLFRMQHASVCKLLLKAQGIETARASLRKQLDAAKDEGVLVETWRARMQCTVQEIENVTAKNGQVKWAKWPIFVSMRREAPAPTGDEQSLRFTVRLIWHRELFVSEEMEQILLTKFAGDPNYKELLKRPNVTVRVLVLKRGLSAKQAGEKAFEHLQRMHVLLNAAHV
ncbi:MAG: PD-(D/E)XK nuclease family protein [Burkholderiales bacterium]|nr:PD-(D/E)XK nuclease family protein [Burkholderiales bacterium]